MRNGFTYNVIDAYRNYADTPGKNRYPAVSFRRCASFEGYQGEPEVRRPAVAEQRST